MLTRFNGIVLHSVKYSENSLIVKMYTEQKGICSFMVNSVKSKRSRFKPVYFQPLTVLDFMAYYRENKNIYPINEISSCSQYHTIPYDVLKSAQVLFIAEVLLKTLHENESNYNLYCFITGSLDFLDTYEGKTADFHLIFLLNLANYLGFSPQNNYSPQFRYFNLYEGKFENQISGSGYLLDELLSEKLSQLMNAGYDTIEHLNLNYQLRKDILNKIIEFFRIHMNSFGTMKSNVILEEVLA